MSCHLSMIEWSWWRHQMETFSALLALCAGNSPATGEFPTQRPVTRSFDVFSDLRLNKRSSKQSRGWWFVTRSHPLWRHCTDDGIYGQQHTNEAYHFDIFHFKTQSVNIYNICFEIWHWVIIIWFDRPLFVFVYFDMQVCSNVTNIF